MTEPQDAKKPPTVEEHLAEWAPQSPTCVVTAAEWEFVADVRRGFRSGVGFGWMQSIIEVEWTAKHGAHGWGPRCFEGKIAELRAENLRLRAALRKIEQTDCCGCSAYGEIAHEALLETAL